jgi:hypothetical protein
MTSETALSPSRNAKKTTTNAIADREMNENKLVAILAPARSNDELAASNLAVSMALTSTAGTGNTLLTQATSLSIARKN